MNPDTLVTVLDCKYFDPLNPKYQAPYFENLPNFAVFRYNGRFHIKAGRHHGREINTDIYSEIPAKDFVFCAKPVKIWPTYLEN